MIKNAISYHVEMPNYRDMTHFIVDSGFYARKPGNAELSTVGFSTHPETSAHISLYQGGYCLAVTVWKKNVKASMVKPLLQERIEALSYTPKKAEKSDIRDEIITDLIGKIPAEPKTIYVYYHTASKKLIVDTVNQKEADLVTGLLRKTIGSLKATTLYVDQSVGLTAHLSKHLRENRGKQLTKLLTLGNSITLKGCDSEAVNYKNIDLHAEGTCDEIADLIDDCNMTVKEVELQHGDIIFKLTDGFKLKSVDYCDTTGESDWQSDTYCSMVNLVSILDHLVSEFTVVKEE